MTKIKIGKRFYTIEDGDLLENVVGQTNYFKRAIIMRPLLDKENYKQTLAHELTHAYMYELGFADVNWDRESVCNFVAVVCEGIAEASERLTNIKFGEGE